jgi:hypothetical protein
MKFKKKPVVIEAIQLKSNIKDMTEILKFVRGTRVELIAEGMVIYTLEGPMLASFEDWIIKGVKGEFYPCKPDIFEQTYELVE